MLGVVAIAALAPAASADKDGLEGRIIVTGERVARSLLDTTSSVEVFSRAQIEESPGSDRIEQVLELVPNVQISSGAEGPTIRGQDTTGPTRDLPAFLGGTRPRTTLVVDGRPVSFNEFIFGAASLWDVNRVEVFRTPQTTTQGQNSIAGGIFVETGSPSFLPEYRGRLIIGDFHTRQVSLLGSGPVSEDLAVRVTGDFRYSRPSSVMTDKAEGADPNHDVYGLLRLKLLARPDFLPGSRIELGLTHSQSQMPQFEGVRPPFQRRRDPNPTYGVFRINVEAMTVRATIPLSSDIEGIATLTAGDSRVRRFAPRGLGETRIKGADWSAENLLHWSRSSSLDALVGVSYRRARLNQIIDLSQLSGIGKFNDDQSAFGLFGEATWSPATKLHLTAGLRYQRDDQVRTGALETPTGPIALDYDRSFEAFLPKLSVSYDLARDIRVGALIQRAYNPGGTTLRFDTGSPDQFGAEYLWDYELFGRATLLGGRLSLSTNAFYYDMTNAQRARTISIVAPTSSIVGFADLFNVRRARSMGAEFSTRWQLAANLSLHLGAGFVSTKILDADAPYLAFEGKVFQRSPRFSGSAAAIWEPINGVKFSAQLRHNSGYFSDDLNQENRRINGWTRLDIRGEYRLRRFQLFGYVRNVFDNFYLTYVSMPNLATAGDPREFGIGLEAEF